MVLLAERILRHDDYAFQIVLKKTTIDLGPIYQIRKN